MTEFIHHGDEKKQYVQRMFDEISFRYDFLNHLLSFGIDFYWRRQLVKQLNLTEGELVLDVATGTGDVGFAILKHHPVTVIGLDYAYNMNLIGRAKALKRQVDSMHFVQGDGELLPFADHQFDVLTISYGFRNIGHYDQALKEFNRVLKPGGRLAILEFSRPRSQIFGNLYRFYFSRILPRLAGLFSRGSAYRYLPESVAEFPAEGILVNMIENAGFKTVAARPLTFGISTIYSGISLPE